MVCDKEIAKACGSCSTRKPTRDYTEVQVQWSNGSRMNIAVCIDCATSHVWATPEAKAGIALAHQTHWDKHKLIYDPAVTLV